MPAEHWRTPFDDDPGSYYAFDTDGYYHGPTPPGPGWKLVGKGPHGRAGHVNALLEKAGLGHHAIDTQPKDVPFSEEVDDETQEARNASHNKNLDYWLDGDEPKGFTTADAIAAWLSIDGDADDLEKLLEAARAKHTSHAEPTGQASQIIAPAGKKIDNNALHWLMNGVLDICPRRLSTYVNNSLRDIGVDNAVSSGVLFTQKNREKFQADLASVLAQSDLVGRSRVRTKADQVYKKYASLFDDPSKVLAQPEEFSLLTPMEAYDYFINLVPTLNVHPDRFGELMERKAFTLAVATEKALLDEIQDIIAESIRTGAPGGAVTIRQLLIQTGVAPDNPQYCFLPGTQIEGEIQEISRADYDGPAVQIETNDGRVLAVTINHPVLTTFGWKAAGDLEHGDNLVCYGGSIESLYAPWLSDGRRQPAKLSATNSSDATRKFSTVGAPAERRAIYDQDVPARIEDVFDSLFRQRESFCHTKRPVAALDFHGDAIFMQGKIDSVRSNWILQGIGDPLGIKRYRKVRLVKRNIPAAILSGHGRRLLNPAGKRPGFTVGDRLHGRDNMPLHGWGTFRPLSLAIIGSIAHLDASLYKARSKTTGGDTELAGNLMKSFPGLVSTNRITKIKRFRWTGHVYNLQTRHGFLASQGIVTSNCEAVYRTNVMDASAVGHDREMASPDMQETFPAFMYSAITTDKRGRPWHVAKNGLLYPSKATFTEVRGTDAEDVINCRCTPIAIDKFDLADRLERGEIIQTRW